LTLCAGCYPAYKKQKRRIGLDHWGWLADQGANGWGFTISFVPMVSCWKGTLRLLEYAPGNWVYVWSETKVSSGVVKREGFILAS
jgi:hypothetical protein